MKRFLSILLLVTVLISSFTFYVYAEEITLTDGVPVILDTNDSGFVLNGKWTESGIKLTDALTYYTSTKGRYAMWYIDVGAANDVEVSIPKTPPSATANEDSATEFEIYAGGKSKTVTVDFTKGTGGWYSLGKFDFTGGGDEYVKITKTTESGNTRVIGVKLAVNEPVGDTPEESILVGEALHIFERMGMFTEKTITDEYLDKELTRAEMAVMLTSLFGKTDEIASENNTDNFADVPDDYSARNTLAYIKAHPEFGIKRHGKNSFSPESNAGKTELLKFILHQLGYYELTDYQPSQAQSFAESLGIDVSAKENLTARTMAETIYSAFQITVKNNSEYTLFEKIVRENSGVKDSDLFNRKPLTKTLLEKRSTAKNKDRGVIYNNDGNDVYKSYDEYPNDYPVTEDDLANISAENFLKARTIGITDSQVNTVFYCTGVFNSYTHTTSGETDTRKRDWSYLLKTYTGKDTLETMIDYGDENNIDVFWSMRMNDTHDYAYEENQLDSWKQANLDKLVSRKKDSLFMAYGARRWSSVDYTHTESRQKVYDILKDTVSRYDVDGIELDFTRWPIYFKEVTCGYDVYPENLERMNDLMRMIRALTDMYSAERNKPLLISIYVPDSTGFCKAVGLDIETWLKEDLIDIVSIGCHSGAFQSWESAIADYAGYDVPVYAALDPLAYEDVSDKFDTDKKEAALAYAAGAKGMYTYNYFDITHERFDILGSADTCGEVDSTYISKRKKYSTLLAKDTLKYVQ